MPTAVVTGGAGFLGSHLCEYLLGKGYRVLCVDNLESSSLENLEHLRDDAFAFLNHDMVDHLEVDVHRLVDLEVIDHVDAFAFLNHDMVDHLEVDEPVDVVYHL